MAENEHELKLVISADTSEAEKKLTDIGKVEIDPVKVDVAADKVEIDAPKVEPVKVPVAADKVEIDAPKVEPVKVPVETPVVEPVVKTPPPVEATVIEPAPVEPKVVQPDPIKPKVVQPDPIKPKVVQPDPIKPTVVNPEPVTVKVKAEPDPLKPKVEQPKPVTVKSAFDSTGFGKITNALHGVKEIANKVVSALGIIGFAIGIVMALADGFVRLKNKIEETSKAIARLRFDFEMKRAASETDRLCTAHERLANLLKEELDTLSKQKAVGDIETTGRRDREDGQRAAELARRIYEAKTPEEEQSLRDRYALEDAQIADRRKNEDRQEQIRKLDKDESAYTAKAKFLKEQQPQIDKQLAYEELNVQRARGSRKDGEEMTEAEKAARSRVEELKKAKKANELAIESLEKEAKFRRDQIAALEAMPKADSATVVALQQQQKQKEKERENEKATTKSDSEWKDRKNREAKKREIDEAVEGQSDSSNKKAILGAQAESARNAAKILREQYEAEMKKLPGVRDAEKLAEIREKIDQFDADAIDYDRRVKDIDREEKQKKISGLESLASRAESVGDVSKNRLTAMGLGSGVKGSNVSSEIRTVIDLLRENVAATKDNKPQAKSSGVAVYGE